MKCTKCQQEEEPDKFRCPDPDAPKCIMCTVFERRAPFRAAARERLASERCDKFCKLCNQWLSLDSFTARNTKSGTVSYCRPCRNKRNKQRQISKALTTNTSSLYSCSTCNEKRPSADFISSTGVWLDKCQPCRRKYNRRTASENTTLQVFRNLASRINNDGKRNFEIDTRVTVEDVQAVYDRTDGCCMFFTSKKVAFELLQPWRISLAVVDRSLPVSRDNLAICAQEWRNIRGRPWTAEKLTRLRHLIGTPCDLSEFETPPPRVERTPRVIECSSHTGAKCKECAKIVRQRKLASGKGYIEKTLSSLRERDNRKRGNKCTLTYDDLVAIIFRQKGLCCYSGVPMVFKTNIEDFQATVERIDPGLGYTLENTSFCIAEMNVCCNWQYDGSTPGKGPQWTRAKFLEFARGEGWDEVEEKEPAV